MIPTLKPTWLAGVWFYYPLRAVVKRIFHTLLKPYSCDPGIFWSHEKGSGGTTINVETTIEIEMNILIILCCPTTILHQYSTCSYPVFLSTHDVPIFQGVWNFNTSFQTQLDFAQCHPLQEQKLFEDNFYGLGAATQFWRPKTCWLSPEMVKHRSQ